MPANGHEPTPPIVRHGRNGLPRVCVALATYNRLEHLKRAVASARAASEGTDVTFAIADGGSTDGTLDWLAEQGDVVVFRQELPLTGAVRAFNLSFGYAVDAGFPFVFHFNDDAEVVTLGAFAEAVEILEQNPRVGEVAFAFDLRGRMNFDELHHKPYGNFGMVRAEAGIAVAQAQGDPSGRAWWNPEYRTYGADCEFACWQWKLGWTILPRHDLQVHDTKCMDVLRELNQSDNPERSDSHLFWGRWGSPRSIEP